MNKPFTVATAPDSVCRPPSRIDVLVDRTFRSLARVGVVAILTLVVALVFEIGGKAIPGIQKYGLDFIGGAVWDANSHQFGILPAIWGTLYSALLALVIGGFFGVAMAIFLTQDFLPPRLAAIFASSSNCSQRSPAWSMGCGNLRGDSGDSSARRLATSSARRASLLRLVAVRPRPAARGAGSRHHDPADHRRGGAGRAARGAAQDQAGGLRHGHDALGSDRARDGAVGGDRNFRRAGARPRARARRDDGARDAGRQFGIRFRCRSSRRPTRSPRCSRSTSPRPAPRKSRC